MLSNDSDDGLRTLTVLLDHGADLKKRDSEGGPLAWAAYHAKASYVSRWHLVRLLTQRGANWKGEQEFGQPVTEMFTTDFARRESMNGKISDEIRELKARWLSTPEDR